MNRVVGGVFMLKTISNVKIEPSALTEERVSTWPPQRSHYYHTIINLGKRLICLSVVRLVSIVSEHPRL